MAAIRWAILCSLRRASRSWPESLQQVCLGLSCNESLSGSPGDMSSAANPLQSRGSFLCIEGKCTYYCSVECQSSDWKIRHKKLLSFFTRASCERFIDDVQTFEIIVQSTWQAVPQVQSGWRCASTGWKHRCLDLLLGSQACYNPLPLIRRTFP